MPPDQGKKTEDSINWEDLPGSIIKLEESKGFKCKTCNRTLNSKTQVVEVRKDFVLVQGASEGFGFQKCQFYPLVEWKIGVTHCYSWYKSHLFSYFL